MKSVTENLLRPIQARQIQEDVDNMEATLASGAKLEQRGKLVMDLRREKERLEKYCAQPLTGEEKDENQLRIKELADKIGNNMPSMETMRKNPAGAVHQNILWNRENKENVLEWKNRKLQQEPDSEDPDLANVEILRPSRPVTYDSTAQIPGHHVMSAQAKENFETALPNSPTSDTALKQVKNRIKRTPEHLRKLREGRMRKLAEKKQQALDKQVASSKASEGE